MLIKEYRIPLPLTKEEYKIAQLYMIAKKSRQESHGEGSGIEILVNEPYEDGPGPDGKGQYTRKVYHVGSHLPAWVKSLIPKSALSVEEEAWNAYPYTKTRFTCPFVEKFNIEIETYYFDDGGHQQNVFNLNNCDLKQREVDTIDIVNEQLYGADYVEEEDPRKFVSQKTDRGPLDEQWINSYWNECEGKPTPLSNGKAIMCAYKLCKVEFRYWGMQTKIEKFIHDVALRKTMLRAHIQAWAWIDEWWGLTIDDIRNIERETQEVLAKKFGGSEQDLLPDTKEKDSDAKSEDTVTVISCPNGITIEKNSNTILTSFHAEIEGGLLEGRRSSSPISRKRDRTSNAELMLCDDRKRNSWSRSASRNTLSSHSQASWRMESIRRDSVSSESGDEFFDCQENVSDSSAVLQKWSSLELLPNDMEENLVIQVKIDSEPLCRNINVTSMADVSAPSSPSLSPSHQPSPCPTTVLILVVHAGSVLDLSSDLTNKKNDFTTFRNSFEIIVRQHYSHLAGRVSIKLISAPSICSNGLSVLSSLAPYGLDLNVGKESTFGEQVPVGALPILGTVAAEYEESLGKTIFAINSTYQEFLSSEEGQGFSGQVCIIGDSVGGLLCYDALCKSHDVHRLGGSIYTAEGDIPSPGQYCNRHRASTSSSTGSNQNLSHFINPSHLFSTNPHSSLPPEPPPSPTITVSFSDAVKEAESRGAKFSNASEFSALPVCSDTPHKFPHSCPVTPENPLTPTHAPIRKISDPLVSCQSASCRQRKVSAPPNLVHSDDGSLGDSDLSNPMFHSYLLHRHSQQTNLHPFPSFAPVLRCDCSLSGEEYETFRKSCSGYNRATSHDCQYGRSVSDSDYHYSSHLPRKGSYSGEPSSNKLEFEVSNFFLFGCPLALVLVFRKLTNRDDKDGIVPRPSCHQVYNLFHPSDPLAARLEPLLSARFSLLSPITIPRYSKYPLGDGQPTHLLECIQSHGNLFSNSAGSPSFGTNRRSSDASILSNMSGMADSVSLAIINALSQRWWGNKRLDYALYCPEGLSNFPSNVLPHLFHASYWESHDVVAFIIRQLGRAGRPTVPEDDKDISVFLNIKPREKWQKKRTSVKLKNIAANHRGYDVIFKGGSPQFVRGRFMYGPLDMVALSGEKVDVHIMMNPPTGDWKFIGTATTEKSGRINLPIPLEKQTGYGIFPVKMIVRGDHTTCSNYMAVVPPKTECILFSIDGSFTASVSVTGRDPKVRAGAVDVVRHWQELGYLILYITGRPDMQQQKVVSWLAQHNFPHGLVSFAEGLSTDPLGHKADYLRGIIQESEVVIEAAYGSAKDISVYSSIGLKPEQIYIVGKASKKQAAAAQILVDGYAAHLAQISSPARFRPARGNPEMLIPKGFFGLPGQTNTLRRRRSAKRTSSYPVLGSQPNEGLLESKKMFNHHKPGYKSLRF